MENKKETSITVQEKNISDGVLNRVKELEKEGSLQFPANYSYSNALKSAWLMLQETVDRDKKLVLQSCSKDSIANALLDMVIQGLSPAKKQCYFVPFGGKLQLMRSYMGTVAVTKRLKGVKNVIANVIYEGDEFAYQLDLETGEKKITKHEQSFENIDNTKIKGAYAIVVTEDGMPNHVEVMNIGMIKMAWSKSKTGGQVHKDFSDEMAKKTVISRACKMYINTSDDSDLLIEAINNTTERTIDDKDLVDNVDYEVKEEIKEEGNSKVIDIEPEKEKETKQETKAGQQSFSEPGF